MRAILSEFFLRVGHSLAAQKDPTPRRSIGEIGEPTQDAGSAQRLQASTFVRILKKLPKSSATRCIGRLQVICLKDVRDALGEKWPVLRENAMNIAESVLLSKLSPSDIFARGEEESFLVLFSDLEPDEAALKASAISKELMRVLVGTMPPELGIQVTAKTMQISDAVSEIDPVGDQSDSAESPLGLRHLGTPDFTANLEEFYYWPTLFTREMVTSINTVSCDDQYDAVPGIPDEELRMLFDMEVLKKAIDDLSDFLSSDRKFVLTVPLHVDAINHVSRRIPKFLNSMESELRNYLTIELVGILHETAHSAVFSASNRLQGACRAIGARTSLFERNLDKFVHANLRFLSFHLGDLDVKQRAASSLGNSIASFGRRAYFAGLQPCCRGVESQSVLRAALEAKFDYVSGPAVGPKSRVPLPIAKFAAP